MEQNANESYINVCVIQVQNRAGWLTMRDGLYCIMFSQKICASLHNDKQEQII